METIEKVDEELGYLSECVDPRLFFSSIFFHLFKLVLSPIVPFPYFLVGITTYSCSQVCCIVCLCFPGINILGCIGLCFSFTFLMVCLLSGILNGLIACSIPDPTIFLWWIHSIEKNYKRVKNPQKRSVSSAPSI